MKFVTFNVNSPIGKIQRIGLLKNNDIIDLNTLYGLYLKNELGIYQWWELANNIIPNDLLKFIEFGSISMEAAKLALSYLSRANNLTDTDNKKIIYSQHEVQLLAPIPRPVSVRDCSTFIGHVKGAFGGNPPDIFYKIPAHYRTSHTDVVGPEAPILWPSYTEKLDYELEFAICIGKYGINIPVEQANDYIFGYTIFNDISARDKQKEEDQFHLGPVKGKSFQNSNIMGPCLVTPDEIDPNNLRLTAKINGELYGDGNSRDMYFKFPQLISYISMGDPLYPGEFIASGTIEGGSGGPHNRYLIPGDIVELEVEGIGTLKNMVAPK